jgi:Tfp pilus assembly protein PilZ
MGNNVMLYLDDIQHTNPELLQKFISLCDAQRRIEGVWKGRTRTYDMRGKKFCVVMAGNPYTETGEKFRIPDMLSNRADTYNLGDILQGKDDIFALSYLENALTSNKALQPLPGRDPKDTYKLIKMAQGEAVPVSELQYPYSAAEVNEITEVLKRLFMVQKVLLSVNMQYIASASQDDAFRTEPPFKLQGSYRNMNKVTEKVVAAHTPEEVEALIDNHYAGESQTLTTGAEQNLLKLAEMRGRQTPEQAARWAEIKKGFVRVKMMGGKEDDPVARVTGTLAGLGEQLASMEKSLASMAAKSAEPAALIAAELGKLHAALDALASRELLVNVERDPKIAELVTQQLSLVESTLAPVVKAVADSLVLAGTTARAVGEEQSKSLERAIAEAASKVQQIGAAQQQVAAAQAQQIQSMQQAHQLAAAQHQQMAQAQQAAQQMAQVQQQVIAQQHQAVQSAQQMASHAREVLATAPAPAQPGALPQQMLFQRPDATPEENEMIARAQIALQNAKQQGALAPEVGAAVHRVEHRIGELASMVRQLQDRIGQGVQAYAQSTAQGSAAQASAAQAHPGRPQAGRNGGGNAPRFDAAIDFQSPSNFYRWRSNGDVVNEGGVFIATRRKVPNLGQEVIVRVTLPGGVELEARAVVEWARPPGNEAVVAGFGARFVDLPTYARQLIDHFVARREPLVFEQA